VALPPAPTCLRKFQGRRERWRIGWLLWSRNRIEFRSAAPSRLSPSLDLHAASRRRLPTIPTSQECSRSVGGSAFTAASSLFHLRPQ
jgi:hypothetical protein